MRNAVGFALLNLFMIGMVSAETLFSVPATVELRGRLERTTADLSPPNDAGAEPPEAPGTAWILQLAKPVFLSDPPREGEWTHFILLVLGPAQYQQFERLVGRKVVVSGDLIFRRLAPQAPFVRMQVAAINVATILEDTTKSPPAWWGPTDGGLLMFSAAGAKESDTGSGPLSSLRITTGIWEFDVGPPEFSGRWVAWLSYGSKGDQAISRFGMDYGLFTPAWGPVRLGGFIRGSIEHREEDPKAGLGGSMGVGGDVTFWVHPEWNLGIEASRNFGISTKTWSDVALCVRFTSRKLNEVLNP